MKLALKSIIVIIALSFIINMKLSRNTATVSEKDKRNNVAPEIVATITPNTPPSTFIEGNEANSAAQIQVYNNLPTTPINSLTKFVNDPTGGKGLKSDVKETNLPESKTGPHTNVSSPQNKMGEETAAAKLATAQGYKSPVLIDHVPVGNNYADRKK